MTLADCDFVVRTQFFHTLIGGSLAEPRLIGRRVSMKIFPLLRKTQTKPTIGQLIKRKSTVVKHHFRTIPVTVSELIKATQNVEPVFNPQNLIVQKGLEDSGPHSPGKRDESTNDSIENDTYNANQLTQFSSPDETSRWLTIHRFEKYLDVFSRFSGSDMLRMSREDLMQICGQADGIRLHNALHLKPIAPKLKLYVCRENALIFNAVFLQSHSHTELVQQLCSMVALNPDQVKAVYMEGPQSIHIQISDEVLRHVEEDSMFSLSVLQENGSHIFLLRKKAKH